MRGCFATAVFILLAGIFALNAVAATDNWQNLRRPVSSDEDALVVVEGGDERLTISMQDGSLLRITTDNGEEQVIEVDLSLMEDVIAEAMVGVREALAELSNLQIEVQVDPDESIVIGSGDEMVMIELPEIMAEVQEDLADALQDLEISINSGFHRAEWFHHESEDADADEIDQLRDELNQLRGEMKRLRAELRRLERSRSE
jgi:hypothetical protein